MTYIGWLRYMFSQLYHYFDLSPSPPRSYTVHISSENSAICCSVNIGKWEIETTDSLKVSYIYDLYLSQDFWQCTRNIFHQNMWKPGGNWRTAEINWISWKRLYSLPDCVHSIQYTGISTRKYTSFQALFQPLFKGTVSRDFRYLQMILKDRTWVPSVPLKKNGILQFPINCCVVVEGGVVV